MTGSKTNAESRNQWVDVSIYSVCDRRMKSILEDKEGGARWSSSNFDVRRDMGSRQVFG